MRSTDDALMMMALFPSFLLLFIFFFLNYLASFFFFFFFLWIEQYFGYLNFEIENVISMCAQLNSFCSILSSISKII